MEIDYVADIAIAMSWLYRKIAQVPLAGRFAGFLMTHGTDTAMQSLTYLSFMLGPRCPFNIITVVSQRTIEMAKSDALANMRFAQKALRKLMKPGTPRGIHSVCAGGSKARLFNAPTSKKISDQDVDLFHDYSSDGPILKTAFPSILCRTDGPYLPFHRDRDALDLEPEIFCPIILRGVNVACDFKSRLGEDPTAWAEYVRTSEEVFFILETFGSFTANRKIVNAVMEAARQRGKIFFATNPFPNGNVSHEYVDSQYLAKQGIVPIQMLTHAVYPKLKWALKVFGRDPLSIVRFTADNNFIGEQFQRLRVKGADFEIDSVDGRACVRIWQHGEKKKSERLNETTFLPAGPEEEAMIQDPKFKKWCTNLMMEYEPRYMSDEDWENVIAMNDPEIRHLITRLRNKIYDLCFWALEKYVEYISAYSMREISASSSAFMSKMIRQLVSRVLQEEYDSVEDPFVTAKNLKTIVSRMCYLLHASGWVITFLETSYIATELSRTVHEVVAEKETVLRKSGRFPAVLIVHRIGHPAINLSEGLCDTLAP